MFQRYFGSFYVNFVLISRLDTHLRVRYFEKLDSFVKESSFLFRRGKRDLKLVKTDSKRILSEFISVVNSIRFISRT